jgi:hypothetical protein
MPRGQKGEKRPADVNARVVRIAKIATGEIEDTKSDTPSAFARLTVRRQSLELHSIASDAGQETARRCSESGG